MKRNEQQALRAERYRVYVTTHRGMARLNNEDNFTVNNISKRLESRNTDFSDVYDAPLLAAVFDGMGGESKGEYASYISSKAAKSLYFSMKATPDAPIDALAAAFVQRANDEIRAFLEDNNCSTGGSTMVAGIFKNEIIYPFSIGDSRIYLYRNEQLTQISKDQTLAMKKVEANIYTPEEAERSPDSHRLTAFLGVDYNRQGLAAQYYEPIVMQKSDKLLLCSDGLYDELSAGDIRDIIRNHPDNPTMALVKAALQSGGSDNVTCVLIEREI